jgi:pilus assembly protein Flp/PilA
MLRVARFTLGGMTVMQNTISRLLRDNSGATAIEYGLIAALISVVIIGAVRLVGQNLTATFTAVQTALAGAAGNAN